MGKSKSDTEDLNNDFFQLLRNLFVIFEFDTVYPESRKILMEKRKIDEDKNKVDPLNLAGDLVGFIGNFAKYLDVFGLLDNNSDEKK